MVTRSKEKKKKKAIINALPKPKLKQIPIKQQNISLLQFSYSSKDPVSTATIQQAAKTILQNANAKIDDGNLAYQPEVMATVLFDKSIGWQSGKFSGLEDDEVDVYRFEDQYEYNGKPLQTTYSTFNITLKLVANAGGGTKRSKKHPTPEEFEGSKLGLNDCLWYCLRDLHSGVKYMPSAINKPFLLKRALGLERKDLIPISKLGEVSKLIKADVNVIGDVEHHHQGSKHLRSITVQLHNQHYTVPNKHAIDTQLRGNTNSREKTIVLWRKAVDKINSSITYQGCDGVTVFPLSRETLSNFWMKPKSCKHIYRQAEKATSAQEMLAEHRALEADIKILKDASKGFVNLYRQLNETKSALFIFAKLNRLLVPPPKLGQLESTWITNAKSGGLIYGKECELEKGYEYDITSFYPSLPSSQSFSVPVGEGVFEHLMALPPDFLHYGLYKVKISVTANATAEQSKLFKFKPSNIYTHFDIKVARDIGLNIELLPCQPNAPLFPTRVPAASIFKPFVDYIFDLRQQTQCPRAKRILNCLWGGLSAKRSTVIDMNEEKVLDLDGRIITHIEPYRDSVLVTAERVEHRFKTSYARLFPFITSYGRYQMYNYLKPVTDNIFRIHTDGFISNKVLQHLKMQKKEKKPGLWTLDEAKEGRPCRIHNSKYVEWL